MATPKLEPCETCGHPIARTAKTCPGCGAKKAGNGGKIGLIIVLIVVAAMIIGAITPERPAPESGATAAKAADTFIQENPEVMHKAAAANLCLNGIKRQLREPASMKVKEFIGHNYDPAADGRPITIVSGYFISAKNGYGGYETDQYICTTEVVDGQARLVEVVSPK